MIGSLRQNQQYHAIDPSQIESLHGHKKLKGLLSVSGIAGIAGGVVCCLKVPAVTSFLSMSVPALQLGSFTLAGTGAMALGGLIGGPLFAVFGIYESLRSLGPKFDSEFKAAKSFAASLELQLHGRFASSLNGDMTVLRIQGRFSPFGRVRASDLVEKINTAIENNQSRKPVSPAKIAENVIAKELRKVQTRRIVLTVSAFILGGTLLGAGFGFLFGGYGAIPFAAIGLLAGIALAIPVAVSAHYVKDYHRSCISDVLNANQRDYQLQPAIDQYDKPEIQHFSNATARKNRIDDKDILRRNTHNFYQKQNNTPAEIRLKNDAIEPVRPDFNRVADFNPLNNFKSSDTLSTTQLNNKRHLKDARYRLNAETGLEIPEPVSKETQAIIAFNRAAFERTRIALKNNDT